MSLALGGLLVLAACGSRVPAPVHEVRLHGEALGTTWSVALVEHAAPHPDRIEQLRGRIRRTLDRVDRSMSTWREDSELARFNRAPGLDPFRFSPETRRVIGAALELARETGGVFDPTVGPLVGLWGFGPHAASAAPGARELARARARVGWRKLAWDEHGGLRRRVPGVELDLSAIAKGYAVDAVVAELARERPVGLLVEVGGEVRAIGTRATEEAWRVGVEDPGRAGSRFQTILTLTAGALATSGDYRQAWIVDGKRRSHVLDPRTGRPAESRVASASVVAPSCMEADAVATALMVLPPVDGLAWVEDRPWLEALLVVREESGELAAWPSSGWRRWAAPDR